MLTVTASELPIVNVIHFRWTGYVDKALLISNIIKSQNYSSILQIYHKTTEPIRGHSNGKMRWEEKYAFVFTSFATFRNNWQLHEKLLHSHLFKKYLKIIFDTVAWDKKKNLPQKWFLHYIFSTINICFETIHRIEYFTRLLKFHTTA